MQPRVPDRWSPVGRTSQQDYYTRREPQGVYSWCENVDPDGNVRDRLTEAERVQWVEDNRELLDWLIAQPAGVLVDVGSGPGWVGQEVNWHHDYMAIETAPDAIVMLLRQQDASRIACSVEELACDMADIVLAYHVIEHMPDPEREMFYMRRVLKKGGWLVLGTPDFHSPCAVRFGDNYRMLHDPTHCSLFTLESMSRFLRDFGFTIHDVRFPFPERYATAETLLRWNDTSQVSPPWPGNWMTFFCRK